MPVSKRARRDANQVNVDPGRTAGVMHLQFHVEAHRRLCPALRLKVEVRHLLRFQLRQVPERGQLNIVGPR